MHSSHGRAEKERPVGGRQKSACCPVSSGMQDNLRWLLTQVGAERILVRVPRIPEYNTKEDQEKSAERLRALGISNLDLFDYVKRE